ncbi:Transcription elongation factor Spt4 [Giardia muris]|uniref:Transcription elongation factor Spt4 n=1 Tax=Giardia muris TaxID=5742 RepID=A0A4Z1T4H4_GIAMU|nr:Transcription elongation factor Spt4 [Giardia muris]|eukprot:TNJ27957.1 Transcription elongation factor Spt4 [Giardia muris]
MITPELKNVPDDVKRLRACVNCRFVLDTEHWRQQATCPNCGTNRAFTRFDGLVALLTLNENSSYIRRALFTSQRNEPNIPGLYAIRLQESRADDEDEV